MRTQRCASFLCNCNGVFCRDGFVLNIFSQFTNCIVLENIGDIQAATEITCGEGHNFTYRQRVSAKIVSRSEDKKTNEVS
nr:hypothetical protein [Photorhabdus kleinii]